MGRLQNTNYKMTLEEKIKAAKKRIAELKILIKFWSTKSTKSQN